jgi:hypothetical protein
MKVLQKIILLFIFLTVSFTSFAQDRFWTGNDGGNNNWNDPDNWSATSGGGASATVPTAANNVIFDANSFLGSAIVRVDTDVVCNSFTWTVATGTLTSSDANRIIRTHNNFTITPAVNVTGYTGHLYFEGTANHTVDLANHNTFGRDIQFNGVGGAWTVTGDINVTRDVVMNAGTVVVNGNVSAGDDLFMNVGATSLTIGGNLNVLGDDLFMAVGTGDLSITGVMTIFDDINMDGGTLNVTGTTHADDVSILDGVATFADVNVFDDFRLENGAVTNDVTVNGLITASGSVDPDVDIRSGTFKNAAIQSNRFFVRNGAIAQNIASVTVTDDVIIQTAGSMTLGVGSMTVGDMLTMDEATFDTNSQDITIADRFDCAHTDARTLTLGSSTITIQGNDAGAFDHFDLRGDNLTFSGSDATLVFTATGQRNIRPNNIVMTMPHLRFTNGANGARIFIQHDNTTNRLTFQTIDIQTTGQEVDINATRYRPLTFTEAINLPASTTFDVRGVGGLSAGDMTTLGNIFEENVDLGAGANGLFYRYTRFEKNFSIDSGTLLFSQDNNQNVEFQGTTTLGVGDAVDVNFNGESDTGAANGGNYTFLGDVTISDNSTILFDNNGNGAGINSFATGTTITVGQNATVTFNNDGTGGAGEGSNHFFNVTLGAGSTWMFQDAGTNTSYVYGNFLVPFDCANPVTIRSFSTTDDALVDFQNQPVPQWPQGTTVSDIDNIGLAMTTDANDGGNNTNISFPAAAAGSRTLYWIAQGNTDSWNNTANWSSTSGGVADVCTPPTINDDVFFDANSFSVTSSTVNLDGVAECRGMDWTGSTNTPNLFGASTISIGGSVALSAGMTNSATGNVTFVNTTGSNVTLETFGESFGGIVTFNATSAWVLVDGFKVRRDLNLVEGTFNTNGQTLEVEDDLYSNNGNTRSLIFDNSAVTIGGVANSSHVDFYINGNNMTFSAGGTASITFKNTDPTLTNQIRLSLGSSNSPKTMPDLFFDNGTGAIANTRTINIDTGNGRTTYNNITLVQTGHTFTMDDSAPVTVNGTLTLPDNTIAQIRTRDNTNIANVSIYNDVTIGQDADIDFGINEGGFFEFTTGSQITVGQSSTVRFTNNELTVSNVFENISLLETSTFLFSKDVTSNIINGTVTTVGGCAGRVIIDSDDLATAAVVYISNAPYPMELNTAQVGNITAQGSLPSPFYIRSLDGLDGGGNTNVDFTSDPTPRDLYWVGAGAIATTSNWSDCNNWSLASGGAGGELPPDNTDNAIFDLNSFSLSSATVTIDAATVCDDMTWTAGVTNNPLLTGASDMNIFGSVDIQATMQPIATNMTGLVKLQSTTTATINMPSNSFLDVEVRGAGGVHNMLSDFTVENTLTLFAGTLDTQNFDLTVGNFDTNQVLTRSLILGNSTMTITEGLVDFQGNTNSFTLSSNPTASIVFTTATSVVLETGNFTKTIPDLIFTNPTDIDINNTTPNDVNLITFGDITVSQTAASTFNINGILPKTFENILLADNTTGSIGGASAGLTNTFSGTVILGNSNTITVSDVGNNDFNADITLGDASTLALTNVGGDTNDMINLNLNRASTISFSPTAANNLTGAITVNTDCSAPAIINSSSAGNQATLTLTANQDLFNTFVQDINVAGATLNAATAGADLGNNAGNITFNSTPRTLYWVGKQGVAPNSNWSEAGNWSLASGGTAGECIPTINDDVFFDANSFSVASSTVTMDLVNTYARNMDWTGATNTPALVTNTITQTLNLGGNLKFIPAMTLGNGNISDTGGSAPTIGSVIFTSVSSDGNIDYTIDMGDTGSDPALWTKRFRRADFNANLVENLPATTWLLESPFAVTRHSSGTTRGGIYLVAGSFATDGFDMEARYITANTGASGFNITGFADREFNMVGTKFWIRGTDATVFGNYNIDLREDGAILNLISDASSQFDFYTNVTYSVHVGESSKTIPDLIFSDPSTSINIDDSGLTAGQVITFNAFDVQEAGIDINFNGDAQKIFLESLTFLDNTNLLLTASSDITQRNDFQGLLTLGTGSITQLIGANDYVGLNVLEGGILVFNGTGNHDFQSNAAPVIARENAIVFFNNTQAAPNINTFDQATMFGGVVWVFSTTTDSDINNIIIDPSVDCTNLVTITSNAAPTQAIVDFNNPLTLSDVNINNINNTGALVTVNSFIFGANNVGNFLDNTLERDLFWIGDGGAWNDPAHWSLASGGIGGECPPRIIDNVVFDANSFSIPAQTVTVEDFPVSAAIPAEAKSINFTGTTDTPTFLSITSSTLEVGGDFTLIAPADLTWAFDEPVTFSHETGSLVAANITLAGQTLLDDAVFDGRLDETGDGWLFVDAFTTTDDITLDNGDLDFNSQDVTASAIDVDVNDDGTGADRSLNTDDSQMTITGNAGVVLDLRGNDNTFTISSTDNSVTTFTGTGNIDMRLGSTSKTMPHFIYDRAGATSANRIRIFTANHGSNRMTFRDITSLDNGTGSTDFQIRGNMAKYYEDITLLDGMDAFFTGRATAIPQSSGNFFNIGNGLEPGISVISGTFTMGDDTELEFIGTSDFRQAVTIGTTVNNATGATFDQSLFRSTFNIASGSTNGNVDLTFNNNTEFRDDVHIWGGDNGTSTVTFNDDVRLQGTGVCNAPFPAVDVLGDGIAPLTFHAANITFNTTGNTDFGATLTFMEGGINSSIGDAGANSITIYRCDVDYLGTGNNAVFNSSGNVQSIAYFAEKLNITSMPTDFQSRMTFNGRTYFRDDVTLGSKQVGEGFSNGVAPLLAPGLPPINFNGAVDYRTALAAAVAGNQNQGIDDLGWLTVSGAPATNSGILLDIGQNARVEFTDNGGGQESTFIDVQYDVNCVTNYSNQNNRTFSNIFLTDFNIFNMPNRNIATPLVENSGGLTRVDEGYIVASVGCDAWIRFGSTISGVQTDLYLDNDHTTGVGQQWVHVDMLDVNVDDGSILGMAGTFGQAEAASSQDLGNNSTIPTTLTFTTPAGLGAYYWVGDGNNGLWSDPDNWALASGAVGNSGVNDDDCIPSSSDNIFFDNNSFAAGNNTVTVDVFQVRGRSITWEDTGAAAVTNDPVLEGSNVHVIEVYGDYNLATQNPGGGVGTMDNNFPGLTHMRGPMVNSGSSPTRIKHIDSNGGRFFGPVLFEGNYDPITSAIDNWVIDDEMNVESNLGDGDITIQVGNVDSNDQTLSLEGDWTITLPIVSGGGVSFPQPLFLPTSSTVIFDGNGLNGNLAVVQGINVASTKTGLDCTECSDKAADLACSTSPFYNLVMNKTAGSAGSRILNVNTYDISIFNDLDLQVGEMRDNGNQIRGNSTGALTMSNNTKLRLGLGNNEATVFPTCFQTANIDLALGTPTGFVRSTGAPHNNDNNASMVHYISQQDQLIAGSTKLGGLDVGPAIYGTLHVSNSVKSLTSGVTVEGSLRIDNAATLRDMGYQIIGNSHNTNRLNEIIIQSNGSSLVLGTDETVANLTYPSTNLPLNITVPLPVSSGTSTTFPLFTVGNGTVGNGLVNDIGSGGKMDLQDNTTVVYNSSNLAGQEVLGGFTYRNLTIGGLTANPASPDVLKTIVAHTAGNPINSGTVIVDLALLVESGNHFKDDGWQITGATGTGGFTMETNSLFTLDDRAGVSTEFPINYLRADISFADNSEVIYNGDFTQNISKEPVYYDVTATAPVTTASFALVDKIFTPANGAGETIAIRHELEINPHNHVLDNGTQINNSVGPAGSIIMNSTGAEDGLSKLSIGTEPQATQFPTNFSTYILNDFTTISYNSNALQQVKGLNAGGATGSYYDLILTQTTGGVVIKYLDATTIIRNDFTMNDDVWLGDNDYQITGNATGDMFMGGGSLFALGGNLNLGGVGGAVTATIFPTTYPRNQIHLNSTSTVFYLAAIDQIVSGEPTYGNLSLGGSGLTAASPFAAVNKTFDNSPNGTTYTSATILGSFLISNGVNGRDNGLQLVGSSTGTMTLQTNSQLTLGAGNSATFFPTLFTSANIDLNVGSTSNATVSYAAERSNTTNNGGTSPNTVPEDDIAGSGGGVGPVAYRHLIIESGGNAVTKTLDAGVNVRGDLTIESNNTLDVLSQFGTIGVFDINLGGDWTNNNGTFSMRTGTVILDNDEDGSQSILTNGSPFFELQARMTDVGGQEVITMQDMLNIGDGVTTNGTHNGAAFFERGIFRPQTVAPIGDTNANFDNENRDDFNDNTTYQKMVFHEEAVVQGTGAFPLPAAFIGDGTPNDASFVDGSVMKIGNEDFYFPVGNLVFYAPAGLLDISSGDGNPEAFSAYYKFDNTGAHDPWLLFPDKLDPGKFKKISRQEFWLINRSGNLNGTTYDAASSANVSLSWHTNRSGSVGGPLALQVAHWTPDNLAPSPTDLGTWGSHGNSGTADITGGFPSGWPGTFPQGTIKSSIVVNDFSPFTFGTTKLNNILPIELLYFEGEAQEDFVELRWETVSEYENDYFTLEKSKDGISFEEFAEIPSKGAGVQNQKYIDYDMEPYNGLNYYRLKQTDFDGTSTYSKIISVYFSAGTNVEEKFVLYPNPTDGSVLNLGISGVDLEGAELMITDMLGREVYHYKVENPSVNVIPLTFYDKLASGNYILKLVTRHRAYAKPFIVE